MERQAAATRVINAILPMERPYRLRLGLDPNVSLTRNVISAAYRKQALHWHPDRYKESEKGFAQHMTVELNEPKDKLVELCDNQEILEKTNLARG
jgi:DnaJ-class molecular chaperone